MSVPWSCVPVRVTPFLTSASNIEALIDQRRNMYEDALCRIGEIKARMTYSITPEGLRHVKEGACDQCLLRVGLMAANDLEFTNEGLTKLLELLEVPA